MSEYGNDPTVRAKTIGDRPFCRNASTCNRALSGTSGTPENIKMRTSGLIRLINAAHHHHCCRADGCDGTANLKAVSSYKRVPLRLVLKDVSASTYKPIAKRSRLTNLLKGTMLCLPGYGLRADEVCAERMPVRGDPMSAHSSE
jgi:hypothetical protein